MSKMTIRVSTLSLHQGHFLNVDPNPDVGQDSNSKIGQDETVHLSF